MNFIPNTILKAEDLNAAFAELVAAIAQKATPADIQAAINALVNAAPGQLDTLKELADAIGDDPNFAVTIAAQIAAKAPLNSPALTGSPTAPTPATTSNDTSIATTAFALALLRSFGVGNTATVAWTSPDDWTKATGTYIVTAANFPTHPFPGNATDCVVMHSRSTSTANQIAFIAASGVSVVRIATRRWGGGSGGAWSAWTEVVLASGGTMSGPLNVPAGASGTQAPQVQEVVKKSGDTMTGNLSVPSLNSGQLAGMRNRIINGGFKVDQRNAGAAQTYTAGAAVLYGIDRFAAWCTGASITGQRIALANGQNRYRFTGAAGNTGLGIWQRIEAVNCMDMAGQTATLQAKLSSTSLTTVTWTAHYANTTDAFGSLASPTKTQISTGTFTISGTESTYSAQIAIPSAATTGIEIVFTAGSLLAGQTLTIGDMQLELGTQATAFEQRPYGLELSLCQRYYEASDGQDDLATTVSGSKAIGYFKVTKRAAPTFTPTFASGSGAVFSVSTVSFKQTTLHSVLASMSWVASSEL